MLGIRLSTILFVVVAMSILHIGMDRKPILAQGIESWAGSCLKLKKRYDAAAGPKAFAASNPNSGGGLGQACGASWEASSKKEAERQALQSCNKAKYGTCWVTKSADGKGKKSPPEVTVGDLDLKNCNGNEPEKIIKGCTTIINASALGKKELAIAHNKRGTAYADKGFSDLAVDDYTKAIKLNPNYGYAYFNRGLAHRENKRWDNALADFKSAINETPVSDEAHKKAQELAAAVEVEISQATPPVVTITEPEAKPPPPSDFQVCNRAVNRRNNDWEQDARQFAQWRREAERRSLTLDWCRVALGLPKADTLEELAKTATVESNGDQSSRIALVVGNSRYRFLSQLPNPRNDAELMASALRRAGFNVTLLLDADLVGLRSAMLNFGETLRAGVGAGLFYYAGHGVQSNGENFLIPVDANIEHEDELAIHSVKVGEFLALLESARSNVNIVILDACRNNPLVGQARNLQRGLASVEAPNGTLVSYSTSPGKTADDGPPGTNSIFTAALAKNLVTPGLEIGETFRLTRKQVRRETKNTQTPWELTSLENKFYFVQH